MVKKGDTLIEVMLAVGIFSMIAIAIVAVMSNGVSGAQTALETTLAREEIDTQAEALRFIQTAYVADKDNADSKFKELWKAITKRATVKTSTEDISDDVLQYHPATCQELYNGENNPIASQKAFVINPKALGAFVDKTAAINLNNVLITNDSNNSSDNKLFEASIYPRLIYDGENSNLAETSATTTSWPSVSRAEGIYIIAVRDAKTTVIDNNKTAAFYDFYIRTCWYGSDANEPSTISTVIRLYDPDIIKEIEPEQPEQPESGDGDNIVYLQNLTNEKCMTLAPAQSDYRYLTSSFMDKRDGTSYKVSFINGRCWMNDDLHIGRDGPISSQDSNFSSPANYDVFAGGDLTAGNTYVTPRTHIEGNKVWYNYCAATAGQVCSADSATAASQDICPSGWRLPTKAEIDSFNRTAVTKAAARKLHLNPNGFYDEGSLKNNYYGYWWTSSAFDSSSSYGFMYVQGVNSSLPYAGVFNRADGFHIRCVRKD